MSSFVSENRRSLAERHYIRKAGTEHYWFDFHAKKLESYRARFGDDFCLVLFGSEAQDDAYVLPYLAVQEVFNVARVDRRGRWIGTVVNEVLRSGGTAVLVSAYYNQFHLLGSTDDPDGAAPADALSNEAGITRADVQQNVRDFNTRFQDVVPYRKLAISRNIARPGLIATYVKSLRQYKCQLCGTEGFRQKSGTPYAEAHHIIELHQLIPGSYCSDNLVVVCPGCRKRLKYAEVSYHLVSSRHVRVDVNGTSFEFERNILTDP